VVGRPRARAPSQRATHSRTTTAASVDPPLSSRVPPDGGRGGDAATPFPPAPPPSRAGAPHRAAGTRARNIDRVLESLIREQAARGEGEGDGGEGGGVVAAASAPARAPASRPASLPAPPPAPDDGDDIIVEAPTDPCVRFAIDVVAAAVAADGAPLEAAFATDVAARGSAAAAFMASPTAPDGVYYRWRLWSLSNGESLDWWSPAARPLAVGGRAWRPPPPPSARAPPATLADALEPGEVEVLQGILASITLERASVRAAMAFCLDRARAAPTVAAALAASLTDATAPPATLVARLYLAADVLSNAASPAAPGASRFRAALAPALAPAAALLGAAIASAESRMVAAGVRRAVGRVVASWRVGAVFEGGAVDAFEAAFAAAAGAGAAARE